MRGHGGRVHDLTATLQVQWQDGSIGELQGVQVSKLVEWPIYTFEQHPVALALMGCLSRICTACGSFQTRD